MGEDAYFSAYIRSRNYKLCFCVLFSSGANYGQEAASTLYNTSDMFRNKVESVERKASEKGRELQAQLEERTRHNNELSAYETEMKDIEHNLSTAIIANAGEAMVAYETRFIHQQIEDNQVHVCNIVIDSNENICLSFLLSLYNINFKQV